MESQVLILILASISILIIMAVGYWLFSKRKKRFQPDVASQMALDSYLKSSLSTAEIGRFYERYIGYLHESIGREVIYHGAIKGFADKGIDLIVKNSNEILIIQTKCWSKETKVDEDYVFRLWVSAAKYKNLLDEKERKKAKPIFITTTSYSDLAKDAAKLLGIDIHTEQLDRTYPMVKCNVNRNGDKIFHLPFDKYYDNVKVNPSHGDFYAKTVDEAVQKGFRRARV